MSDQHSLKVLIAGGGVAALEAALALRELAGERVSTTLLAREPEFVYRPMRVREPFAHTVARHYPLDEIARDIGVDFRQDSFASLDSSRRIVHTQNGEQLSYDALLLALGARPQPVFEHALTLDDRRLDDQLHGLILDLEGGYIHKIAFLIPSHVAWPLPIYELALMTMRRAWDMNVKVSVTIVTPEDSPLAIFGAVVSQAVDELLARHGIATITGAHSETPEEGEVLIHPGSRRLSVDRVIALPELFGPAVPGIPKGSDHDFIPIDVHCHVPGLDRVYAAGDAVDFPIKHGGIAAQQADVAATSIAALAGASLAPTSFHPVIHGILLGGYRPLFMRADLTGGHGTSSEVSEEPLWTPVTKITAKYLSRYFDARDRAAVR